MFARAWFTDCNKPWHLLQIYKNTKSCTVWWLKQEMSVHCSNLNLHFQICIFTACNSLKWNVSLQLFVKRVKVASTSEKQALLQLDPSFMSDEEDGEGSQVGSWIVRSPSWRSSELTSLLKKLQGKVDLQSGSSHPKNSRVHGEPSTRPPPPSSPAWALGAVDRDSNLRSPSRQPPSPYPESPCSPQRGTFSSEEDVSSESGGECHILDHADSPVKRCRNKRVRPIDD